MKKYLLGVLFATVFFVIGVLTLSHYGLNWDEPNHFMRGQALLQFLSNGEKTYENLNIPRRSQWQNDQQNGVYYLEYMKATHPTLNDIFAAYTNHIFYQKLGWLGDLQAYHLFELFVSSLLVFLVFYIASSNYGKFAGVVAALSLALYPLFLGEAHFNIKDPVEASFFSFSVFFIYLALNKLKYIYFILAGVFLALAVGTKFNAFFIPFIIVPYVLVRFYPEIKKLKFRVIKKIPPKFYLFSLLAVFISVLIYLYFNPMLWNDPVGKFLNEQMGYYKSIGVEKNYEPTYLFYGFNTYPSFFISISTPLIILFLSVVGIYWAIKRNSKEKEKISLLILLWFFVPILRVTVPGSSIYGGVRQIMEYIPPMAILAGLGAEGISNLFRKNKKVLVQVMIIFLFVPLLVKVINLHPNEDVFMNSLIGGLKGAIAKEIPGAGSTLGNPYLQGIYWLNQNAEEGAIYKAAVGMSSNFPNRMGRDDLKIAQQFSGLEKKGEYMMEIYYVNFPIPIYKVEYLETFIDPVYVYKADGVPILKVWKNDAEHTKQGYLNEKTEKNIKVTGGKNKGSLSIQLEKPTYLTRLEITHSDINCLEDVPGAIIYSLNGEEMKLAPFALYKDEDLYAESLQKNNLFVYLFNAYPAKYIQLTPNDPNSCLLQYKKVSVKSLQDINP